MRGGGQEDTEGGDLESSRAQDGLQKTTTGNSGVRKEGPYEGGLQEAGSPLI